MAIQPDQLPHSSRLATIAGFWKRVAALAIDILLLVVPAFLLGLAAFSWLVTLGQAGRLIGFVAALLYFGLLNSRLGHGQTLGKRLMGIRVVGRNGQGLSPLRSILRFLVIAVPYFLSGLAFDLPAGSPPLLASLLGVFLAFVVFGGLGAAAYLYIFNRRTGQSLHDIAVGSYVIQGPAARIPNSRATVPRLHFAAVGCVLALALAAPLAGLWRAQQPGVSAALKPLVGLQAAIAARPGVRHVRVLVGGTTAAATHSAAASASYLLVDAQSTEAGKPAAVLADIAGAVLAREPDLLGRRALIVQVRRGFDLGLAQWSWIYRETHAAAAWREKLR